MPTTCKIEFENNPKKIVYAGQLLRGKVQLNFNVQKTVRSVYIRLHGTAFCTWKQDRKPCQCKEDYLNDITYFVGGINNSNDIELPPRIYNHFFEFLLPDNLPSSIEGDCGYIRYVAKVVFDTSMWADWKFEEPFTVIRPIDLNNTPSLRDPVIVEVQERIYPYYLICYDSEPVKISVRMAVGGYNPGESINLEINVTNLSNQLIKQFTAELIRNIIFCRDAHSNHQREELEKLVEETTEGCDANQNKTINMRIEVPSTPPTDIITSNIVKVRYFVNITAMTSTFYSKPRLDIPVTIGSNSYQNDIKPVLTEAITVASNDVIIQQPSSVLTMIEPKY